MEPLVVTYGEEPDDDDSDSEEERADMAEDEDANPWTGLPRVSVEDEGDPIEVETSARGAEIDRCAVHPSLLQPSPSKRRLSRSLVNLFHYLDW